MTARAPITPEDWSKLHPDGRGEVDGVPYVRTLDRETGGTVLVPVRLTPDVMPGECAHILSRLQGRPGAVWVYCPTCGVGGPSARESWRARRAFCRDFPPAPTGNAP